LLRGGAALATAAFACGLASTASQRADAVIVP
jgi:hypothetical protein